MKNTVRQSGPELEDTGTVASFSAPYEQDGAAVFTATSDRTRSWSAGRRGPGFHAGGGRPVGAFVVRDGQARWHPAVDVTRLLTTAEVVVGAVLVAHRLARRPSTPRARVTMGPGGWVSMKGGAVAVRPGSRPFSRPRPIAANGTQRAPIWARVLSAVPLQSLIR
jgi:hypothetical protein